MDISWDKYFMSMAYFCAMRSKDQSTHIGAVVVDVDNRVLATGYNSFPAGIDDNVPERQSRENDEKYYWFEHAERNAIFNAARHGIALEGCVAYMYGYPCPDCARALIQSGIKQVVMFADNPYKDHEKRWGAKYARSLIMLREADVAIRKVNTDGFRVHISQ